MESNETMDEEIVINFKTSDKETAKSVKDLITEPEVEVIESSAFSGTEVITVILPVVLPALVVVTDKLLNFYLQNRKTLRETSVKVGKNEVSLTGFSEDEIKQLIDDGSLEKLKDIVKKK